MSAPETGRCTVRSVSFEDCEAATELLREVGLVMPAIRADIVAHWERLWRSNPAMAVEGPKPDLGWALEDDGRMVGFFGNVPLLYYYGARRVMVAGASQWGVKPAYRGETDRLATAYFTQPNADLLLVTTGIKPTGRIFERHGGRRVVQPAYDIILYWIVDGRGFLEAALRKKNVGAVTARWGARLASPALRWGMAVGRRAPAFRTGRVDLSRVEDIDDSFDDLWRGKRNEADRLLACRTAACLRWHFGGEVWAERTGILTHRSGSLNGYAVTVRDDAPQIGLKRMKIADVLVAGDDSETFLDLLAGAYDQAQAEGCNVLEMIGLPTNLREIALRWRPFTRTMPVWPAYFRANDDELSAALLSEAAWYLTPYDGDTLLV